MWSMVIAVLAAALSLFASTATSCAQLLVSANDGKVVLHDGVIDQVKDGKDTVLIMDIAERTPRVLAELPVPNSVKSPPSNVAISPDKSSVLIAAVRKYAGDPPRETSDTRVTFVDLRPLRLNAGKQAVASAAAAIEPGQPSVSATLEVGKGPAGVAINRSGDLALVANRDEGSVALLSMQQRKVLAKLSLGDEASGPSGIAFTPDGSHALVTLYGMGAAPTGTKVAVLRIDGEKLALTGQMITTGLGPYGVDVSRNGDIAVVANLGGGATGDADLISVIDLKHEPFHAVNSVSVAPSPEGIKFSPDGRYLAVSSVNGTHKPKSSPLYRDAGVLQVFAVRGTTLQKVAEGEAGHWCQGVAWSKDARTLYLQCMKEKEIEVFSFDPSGSDKLGRLPPFKIDNGPAGLDAAYD